MKRTYQKKAPEPVTVMKPVMKDFSDRYNILRFLQVINGLPDVSEVCGSYYNRIMAQRAAAGNMNKPFIS